MKPIDYGDSREYRQPAWCFRVRLCQTSNEQQRFWNASGESGVSRYVWDRIQPQLSQTITCITDDILEIL